MAQSKGAFMRKKRLSDTGAKVRNVIGLMYIEDLDAVGKTYGDLLAYLDAKHCRAVVSPVHDRDTFTRQDVFDWCERHIDPETGDLDEHYIDAAPYVGKPKKPHVHIGILSKTQRNAYEWSDFMSGLLKMRPSVWEKMEDYDGFTRYCAHLDSPEKARYSAFDIVGIAGADLSCLLKTDEHERISNLTDMMRMVNDGHFKSFHAFANYCFNSGDMDLISSFRSNAGIVNYYFSSMRYERMDKAMAKKAAEEAKERRLQEAVK